MLTIFWLYVCGHEECETHDAFEVSFDAEGQCYEQMEEQSVVMNTACVGCRSIGNEDYEEPCELALDEDEKEVEPAWIL